MINKSEILEIDKLIKNLGEPITEMKKRVYVLVDNKGKYFKNSSYTVYDFCDAKVYSKISSAKGIVSSFPELKLKLKTYELVEIYND